jgi:uncharacterized SAM-binding protein YcdF (DUF218 family)
MFLLKKFLTAWLLPPGLFVALLLVGAIFSRKHKAQMVFLLFMAMGTYLAALGPVANSLLIPLENQYTVPDMHDLRDSQVYVVLMGGMDDKGMDVFGQGTLASDSTARLSAAYRLYRMARKPIIISGGSAVPSGIPESEIGKRFLTKLGVRNDHIMIETRSRDTHENASYTKELCAGRGVSKIVLVTSAYHMKRAMMLFAPLFRDVSPCPSDFRAFSGQSGIRRFFPDAESLHGTSIALRERLGILFYHTNSWRKNPSNGEGKS